MNLQESLAIAKLADHLYDYLPASGNSNTSFPLAAKQIGAGQLWVHGSKLPAIKNFLTLLFQKHSVKIVPFVEEVVAQSITWRGRKEDRTLYQEDILELNKRLKSLGYKSRDLSNSEFLENFPCKVDCDELKSFEAKGISLTPKERTRFQEDLIQLSSVDPVNRGFTFERFLNDLFFVYDLNPRKSFRNVGEQIDGSFEQDGSTYLLEAKWQNSKVGAQSLSAFKGKIDGKAVWSRGLFLSYSGYSDDGLEAFARGKSTNIVCFDGYDLSIIFNGEIELPQAIQLKARRAAETNNSFVPLRSLL